MGVIGSGSHIRSDVGGWIWLDVICLTFQTSESEPHMNKVFIDLEGTIIDVWHGGNLKLKNVELIKDVISQYGVNEVGIFSFAIVNSSDLNDFFGRLCGKIEDAIGVPITSVPTVRDMMRADANHTGFTPVHTIDWHQARNKELAFKIWALGELSHFTNAVLIDDVVPNMSMTYHHDQTFSIHYVKV